MERFICMLGLFLIVMIVGGMWAWSFQDYFSDIPIAIRLFGCVFMTLFGLFGCAIIWSSKTW